MLAYNMRLALKSFRRNPGLTALMIGAIAFGIAACIITITIYHAMSGNPIWWKNERLYALTMDSWDPNQPYDTNYPDLPPPQLSYKDAVQLSRSPIPAHHVIMHRDRGVVTGGLAQHQPQPSVATRITSADFFTMFDVPFLYGGGWKNSQDFPATPVIVLSKKENDILFGGINSVGRTIRWDDIEFRIVGVLNDWFPQPKFYDLNNDTLGSPEDAYIPFGWTEALNKAPSGGNHQCWRMEIFKGFKGYLNNDCIWIQMWVELPNAATRERMQAYLDGYWAQQRKAGRFPRPRNNRLSNVSQWLADNHTVSKDNRIFVGLAFAFLAVCLINTVGLLLAKFLNGAALTGVRRALGASRKQIFVQHLVETGVLAVAGASFGLGLAAVGLWGLQAFDSISRQFDQRGPQDIAHLDMFSVLSAVALAIVAALAAGLYPAWRVGRVPPAVYLKSQ
jgi:putative ABC transport system permease protein